MAVVQYKTPGVYIEEIDAFPPSIVGVETAVPVFIGYTKKAEKGGRSLKLRPVRITSMADYLPIFGDAYNYQFALNQVPTVSSADVTAAEQKVEDTKKTQATEEGAVSAAAADDKAKLQPAADAAKAAAGKAVSDLAEVQAALAKIDGGKDATARGSEKAASDAAKVTPAPANLADLQKKAIQDRKDADTARAAAIAAVPPDVRIGDNIYGLVLKTNFYLYNSLRLFYANGGGDCYIVSVGSYDDAVGGISSDDLMAGLVAVRDLVGPTMLVIPEAVQLSHANYDTLVAAMLAQCLDRQDRVAILDMWGIDKLPVDFKESDLADATTAFRKNISGLQTQFLRYGMAYAPFLQTSIVDPTEVSFQNFDADSQKALWKLMEREARRLFDDPKPAATTTTPATPDPANPPPPTKAETLIKAFDDKLKLVTAQPDSDEKTRKFKQLNQNVVAQIPVLNDVYGRMAAKLGTLPPSPAMAGVYTQNDLLRGVWNAPANVGLVSVVAPTLRFSNKMQDDLNMPIEGLAINAIRDFVGRGTLVWGARTLDGNSNDWRYIQVRRALIYIEQSVDLALNKFVFAPNVAQTWVTVTSMIGSFLRGVWQAGGLMGASPTEAFSIQCGLGSTMTAQDVLDGKMIVQIKLTMVRPAEFIVLTFQQQMQGGA